MWEIQEKTLEKGNLVPGISLSLFVTFLLCVWLHVCLYVIGPNMAGAVESKLSRLECRSWRGLCLGTCEGFREGFWRWFFVLPWKAGFALAGRARAGKTQVCLGIVSVAGSISCGGNGL